MDLSLQGFSALEVRSFDSKAPRTMQSKTGVIVSHGGVLKTSAQNTVRVSGRSGITASGIFLEGWLDHDQKPFGELATLPWPKRSR